MRRKAGQYFTVTYGERDSGSAKSFAEIIDKIVKDPVNYPTGGKITIINEKAGYPNGRKA